MSKEQNDQKENKALHIGGVSGRLCPCGKTNSTSECHCPITDFFDIEE